MANKTIHRNSEVIKNIQNGKGLSNSEAYAYAFGWCWAMLSEKNQLILIAKTEEMLKEQNDD
jgi:hypothetical protein